MSIVAIVVDDSPEDRFIARHVLSRCPAIREVHEAADGSEMYAIIADSSQFSQRYGPHPPPTLILLDINMPRMSGISLLERIAELQRRGEVPENAMFVVLMLTSSLDQRDRTRTMEFACVKDYVEKPIDPEKLNKLLASHYPEIFESLS